MSPQSHSQSSQQQAFEHATCLAHGIAQKNARMKANTGAHLNVYACDLIIWWTCMTAGMSRLLEILN